MTAIEAVRPDSEWLIHNYGPRCTLVCAASALQLLGARSGRLVEIIESVTGFRERYGPPIRAYVGLRPALDRGIELAARDGGVEVVARTRFWVRWPEVAGSLEQGWPVVLNCFRAPSGRWSHSVLALETALRPRRVLTIDPNDGARMWLRWMRPATGWVCTATFISPARQDMRALKVK